MLDSLVRRPLALRSRLVAKARDMRCVTTRAAEPAVYASDAGEAGVGKDPNKSRATQMQCFGDPPAPVFAAAVVPGDVVVFSSLTPHLTGPSVTDGVRKAYILQYAPAGAEVLKGDPRGRASRPGCPVTTRATSLPWPAAAMPCDGAGP